jgi:zinc D-Ala-D-Ala dipeptidase
MSSNYLIRILEKRLNCILLVLLLIIIQGCFRSTEPNKNNPYNLDLVQTIEDYNIQVTSNPLTKLEDIQKIKGVVLDIRYATTNNFTGKVIYTIPKAFARKPVFDALQNVQDSLSKLNLGLKIFDAYRPYAATLKFHDVYPDTNFVANPQSGSRHNRGCAIDLTIIDLSTGKELQMPTEFDNFTEKAHKDYPNFSATVLTNRKLLIDIMTNFGFTCIGSEWWHYDFNGWQKYKLMDITFEELENANK